MTYFQIIKKLNIYYHSKQMNSFIILPFASVFKAIKKEIGMTRVYCETTKSMIVAQQQAEPTYY